jgi:hypothetical protein
MSQYSPVFCMWCAKPNSPDAQFCNRCAKPIVQAPPPLQQVWQSSVQQNFAQSAAPESIGYKNGEWRAKQSLNTRLLYFSVAFVMLLTFVIFVSQNLTPQKTGSDTAASPSIEVTPEEHAHPEPADKSPAQAKSETDIDSELFDLVAYPLAEGELEDIEDISAARKLIEKLKANVNARDESEETPLIIASRNGHIRIMEILLANKANVNAQAGDGRTALIWAVYMNDLNITKLLLKHGANPSLMDVDGFTARTAVEEIEETTSTDDLAEDKKYREIIKLLRQAEKKQSK